MTTRWLTVLAALSLLPVARADITVHELFTDNMVLQADRENPIWGRGDAGESIQIAVVEFVRDDEASSRATVVGPITVGPDGRWMAKLPRMKPTAEGARPATITIRGRKNQISLNNVLVGEVWVCSGQSNMAWQVQRSHDAETVIKESRDPNLRLYSVPHTTTLQPRESVALPPNGQAQFTRWYEAGPKTTPTFSAVAYHFGRHLRQTRKVPIGLIHTSWGGDTRGGLDEPSRAGCGTDLASLPREVYRGVEEV